jgi:hypothetical protein
VLHTVSYCEVGWLDVSVDVSATSDKRVGCKRGCRSAPSGVQVFESVYYMHAYLRLRSVSAGRVGLSACAYSSRRLPREALRVLLLAQVAQRLTDSLWNESVRT